MPHTRWSGQCRATAMPVGFGGLAVVVAVVLPVLLATTTDAFTAGAASAVGAAATVLLPVVVLLGIGMTFSVVRVTVDDEQVVVSCGPWGRPRWSRPRQQIERAETTTLSPGRWGGWGWRWNGSGSAVLLRSGPALRLVPRDGRPFTVSLDDPAAAVHALEATDR